MKTLISLALLVVLSASLVLAKPPKNGKVNAAATKPKLNCSSEKGEVQCSLGNKCIKSHQLCDGFVDCPNKSDELNCQWCNRTFNNELSNRFLIQNPSIPKMQPSYMCFYKFINIKRNTITGIRLRKFSVGVLNNRTKKCDYSWIEIYESEYDEFGSVYNNDNGFKLNRRDSFIFDNEKVVFDDRNVTSLKYAIKTNGRFCGTIHNMWSSFYASKRYIYIKYVVNKTNTPKWELKQAPLNDSFEFEVAFFDRQSTLQIQSSGFMSANVGIKLNYGMQKNKDLCSRVFEGCVSTKNRQLNESTACIITSPGYPGVYPRNLKCQYFIRGSYADENVPRNSEKMLLVNDNLQLGANICHFEPTNKLQSIGQLASSYFCDSGPRSRRESCADDYINIYFINSLTPSKSSASSSTSTKQSHVLFKHLCGMGRLPKIVMTRRSTSLSIELITSSDGLFANSGFIFYALSPSVYFNALAEKKQSKPRASDDEDSDDDNYNLLETAMKRVDRWQVDSCDSDMNECTIIITDEDMLKSKDDRFRVGYLFGINQFQPNGFTLKYVLRTKIFNTIAVFLEKYDPTIGIVTSPIPKNSDPCLINNLSIETVGRYSSGFDYSYYDDSSYEYHAEIGLNHSATVSFIPVKPFKRKFPSYNPNHRMKTIVQLCDKSDFNNSQTRFFLIKTAQAANTKAKSDLVVSYFNKYATLSETARLNDFRISYEFIDFDWDAYQQGTSCDFVYNAYSLGSSSGLLTSPKSRIFFSRPNSASADDQDSYLRCKYRLMAKQNQYIRLTIKSVDFDNDKECQNVFFKSSDKKAQMEKCAKQQKKLIIRDLQHSWSDSDGHFETFGDEDIFNEQDNSNEDSEKGPNMETKLCLCRVKNDSELIYVSKFDMIEIEYKIKLEDRKAIKTNRFRIKYEFVDRDCSRIVKTSPKSKHKGKLVYRQSEHNFGYGTQKELLQFLNKTKRDLNYYESIPKYLSSDDRYKREIENLNYILIDNLNFACKFYISAPLNTFIHTQFTELLLPSNCQENQLRLYSNFSRVNSSLEHWANFKQNPFLKLCSTTNENALDDEKKQNMIVAQFFDESLANSSFTCVDPQSKICFLTSELNHDLNLFKKKPSWNMVGEDGGEYFYNNLVVEVVSNRVYELEFEIKYNFFKVELAVSRHNSSTNHSTSENKLFSSKRNCDFKCFKPSSAVASTNRNSSLPLRICLDQSLVCDGEVHCIFNNLDEINCPIRLNSKTILIVLCTLFIFTLTVLLLFYIFRKYTQYCGNNKKAALFKHSEKIRYSIASQKET